MTTHVPDQQAPAPTCDCHFHIFGPFDHLASAILANGNQLQQAE